MRVLGIETSSQWGSAALVEDGRVVQEARHDQPGRHAESLHLMIAALTRDACWELPTIDLVAVGLGPGSFTGLRVGIALAQGIATGLSIPLVGVPSLQAMAHAIPVGVLGVRVPIVDARRGEVFVAAFSAAGEELRAAAAVRPEALPAVLASLSPQPLVLCGEMAATVVGSAEFCAAELHMAELGSTAFRSTVSDHPAAASCAALAHRWKLEGDIERFTAPALPLYVREADAVLPELPDSPLNQPRS